MLSMKNLPSPVTLSETQYLDLRSSARVLEADGYGDKVLQLADGRIMKLFRLRHSLSSARWFPYSERFARNAEILRQREIPTVGDIGCFTLPSRERTGVLYQPLPGETLRRMGVAGQLTVADCAAAGRLIGELHHKGILFRSIHLGNIVKGTDGRLGLIDIADMSRQPFPLLKSQRLRNFQHLFRPDEDHVYLGREQKEALIDRYLEHAGPRLAGSSSFRRRIEALARLN